MREWQEKGAGGRRQRACSDDSLPCSAPRALPSCLCPVRDKRRPRVAEPLLTALGNEAHSQRARSLLGRRQQHPGLTALCTQNNQQH